MKNLMKRYIWVYDSFINKTENKKIFLKSEERMLTQGLDPCHIDDVSKEHESKIPEYFEAIDKSIKFEVRAGRTFQINSTIDIEILCHSHSSPMNKMFIVEVCAERPKPSCIRNIIYHQDTSEKSLFVYSIKFSVNPHNKIWYSADRIEVLCNLYDPSSGFVKFVNRVIEMKPFSMKIFTNIPITELNKDRTFKMEFKNLLPVPIPDLLIGIMECRQDTKMLIFPVMSFQTFDWIFYTHQNVRIYYS
ncbi:hypothetical protein RF11_08042 [Thelohanellus kitauei]|uniref:Uncharacterized protein n=1 Tax=Thelohanellus kitauei TaxID=669202 RepID=A0A0C2IDW5_THEKT|nr:hypothetical protein RF11_08042 [Thelohanellus kitauei]